VFSVAVLSSFKSVASDPSVAKAYCGPMSVSTQTASLVPVALQSSAIVSESTDSTARNVELPTVAVRTSLKGHSSSKESSDELVVPVGHPKAITVCEASCAIRVSVHHVFSAV
jgi:hypothetical protein